MKTSGNMPMPSLSQFDAARIRKNYVKYCEYVHHGQWMAGRHHLLIAEKLKGVIDGNIKRLMIWMPPRHGKSMEVTETFPSYYLGSFPDRRVLEVSYGDSLARKFGLRNRDKLKEFGKPLFGVSVSETQATKTDWNIAGHRGGMLSVGVGGSITGEGADLLILDDPIKNREEADSETYRKKLLDEWQSTIYTRLHPDASIIVILTRWHENDLAAQLLTPDNGDPEDWDIVSLPCECDSPDDLLNRKIGDPLWPEHGFDKEWMKRTRASVGEYTWYSLYQQKPRPDSGAIFKREWLSKRYNTMPSGATIVQSWDLPFVKNEESAKCAGLIVGRYGANIYVEDCINDKMEFTQTVAAVRDLSAKHPQARAKVVEAAANGHALIDYLKKEIPGIVPYKPIVSKEERARSTTPYYEAGNVYFKSGASWVSGVVEDLIGFPNGKYKDTIDALTQAIIHLETMLGAIGGIIYRTFASNAKKYAVKPSDAMAMLTKNAVFTGEAFQIGISLGTATKGTAFVATGITAEYKSVVVVGSSHCPIHATPVEIANKLVEFVADIESKCKASPEYAYCDGDEQVIYRTVRDTIESKAMNVNVRKAYCIKEGDRINLVQRLVEQERLFISEDCADVSGALLEAKWDESKTLSVRQDAGIADTSLLKALEYTIERSIKLLISE